LTLFLFHQFKSRFLLLVPCQTYNAATLKNLTIIGVCNIIIISNIKVRQNFMGFVSFINPCIFNMSKGKFGI